MTYKEYKGYTKAYVVVYVTGNGVMEDNFVEHDVVYETNSKKDAYAKADELTTQNNSKKDIESTWYDNHYHVNINILSKEGKNLSDEFSGKFKKKLDYAQSNPDIYYKTERYGMTFYIMKGFESKDQPPIDIVNSGFIMPLNTK